jgi:hypothetical protein
VASVGHVPIAQCAHVVPTFRFTLDVTQEQHQALVAHAGAFRKAFNHQIGG